VKQGLYTTVPPSQSADSFKADAFLIASRFAADAVLAYHTALQVHGLDQSVSRRFTVCTLSDVRETGFQGLTFSGVRPRKALGTSGGIQERVMTINRQGLDVQVTDVERTVVDVLDRLEISGGWEEVLRSLEHVRVLDAPAASDYALRLGRASTAAKLGLFLQSHREELSEDSAVLRKLTAALPRRTHRVDRRHPGAFQTIPRWRLSVPEALYDPALADLP
jgi:predicted transcriptional regulator of viral defense system